ncbi:hypothetical protein [Catenulispora subtropica]
MKDTACILAAIALLALLFLAKHNHTIPNAPPARTPSSAMTP